MSKEKEYHIIVGNSAKPEYFSQMVKKFLNEGWSLHGSPFGLPSGGIYQAVVKNA